MASAKAPEIQEAYAPVTHVVPKGNENDTGSPSDSSAGIAAQEHGTPEFTAMGLHPGADSTVADGGVRRGFWDREWFAYVKTKEFWIVLVLGYALQSLFLVTWGQQAPLHKLKVRNTSC